LSLNITNDAGENVVPTYSFRNWAIFPEDYMLSYALSGDCEW
jgi:hypothetical protein